jgi:hypothetical protein
VPGTAQLAATASTNGTPDDESNTTSSPVPMSIAVTRRSRSGQSWLGNRCSMTRLRTASGTVGVLAATAPTRCNFSRAVALGRDMALMNSSTMSSMSTPGSSSCDVSAICRS